MDPTAQRDLDLLFCKSDGSPYDPDEVTRGLEERAVACPAVLAIRFHDQRHTHATLLIESGESIKYAAERLGDTEETVLETYAHVTPRMRSSAVSRVRGFFGTGSAAVDGDVALPRVDTGAAATGGPAAGSRSREQASEPTAASGHV